MSFRATSEGSGHRRLACAEGFPLLKRCDCLAPSHQERYGPRAVMNSPQSSPLRRLPQINSAISFSSVAGVPESAPVPSDVVVRIVRSVPDSIWPGSHQPLTSWSIGKGGVVAHVLLIRHFLGVAISISADDAIAMILHRRPADHVVPILVVCLRCVGKGRTSRLTGIKPVA